jgi:predicted transcriptional regulator
MTNMVREAIEALKELPEDRQEVLAHAILDYASQDDGLYHLTVEERAQVHAGLDEIKRGDIATDDEVAKVYRRIGL